ncbi:MAG: Ig-like domain-containing protein [Anaerolineales bacterium]|jgi:WD40 repeat protein
MNTGRRTLILIAIGVLILAVGASLVILAPKVESFGPQTIQGGLPRSSPFWISFSRQMLTDTIQDRLTISPQIDGEFTWEDKTLTFTPDEDWPAGAEIQINLQPGASSSLGLPTRQELSWSFEVAPILMAYLWPSEGGSDLYSLDIDTGETIQLTQVGGVLAYDFAPDGRTFYYFAENSLGGSDLFASDRFETIEESDYSPSRLLTCQRAICSEPTVSSDGKQLAYLRNDSQIWLLDLQTSNQPQQISRENHQAWQPLWSSTGRLSYYDSTDQAYIIYNPETGDRISLPNQSGENGTWAPGGTALVAPEAFTSETDILRGPTGEEANQPVDTSELEPVRVLSSRLMVYQVGGKNITTLTEDPLAEDFSPAFSPDGLTLAFTRRYLDEDRWTPGRQIWLMAFPGISSTATQLLPLTDSPSYMYTGIVWHPDGKKLAATRFDVTLLTEPPEIWLFELNGNAIRLVIGGFNPQWVP